MRRTLKVPHLPCTYTRMLLYVKLLSLSNVTFINVSSQIYCKNHVLGSRAARKAEKPSIQG